ncbi:MAG: LytTR family DNA-binding domain-containing protein [Cyclobacteriaceae bacterium]
MKVLIIEDELPAIEKLKNYLSKFSETITVLDTLTSVRATVDWLRVTKELPDLLFMDVQLTDGLSFEIFNKVDITLPIIFTTAFDEFAIDAFRLHSIDYLLKPIKFTDLSRAMQKYSDLKNWSGAEKPAEIYRELTQQVYKDRFMVKHGQHIQTIKTEEVSLFYADGRIVYLVQTDGRKYIIDYRMEELQNLLNPKDFFRVNRTYLIHINEVKDVSVFSNSRLKVATKVKFGEDIVVSREKVFNFKNWLEGL